MKYENKKGLPDKYKPHGLDWLWLLIPIGIIVLSILYVPAETVDPSYDPRIKIVDQEALGVSYKLSIVILLISNIIYFVLNRNLIKKAINKENTKLTPKFIKSMFKKNTPLANG